MRKNLFCISKIFLSLATIPLWFIEMLGDVATLPDRYTGKLVEYIVWHSMFENFDRVIQPCIPYVFIAIAVVSAIINAFTLKYRDNKTWQMVAKYFVWIRHRFLLDSLVSRIYGQVCLLNVICIKYRKTRS